MLQPLNEQGAVEVFITNAEAGAQAAL